MNSMRDVMRGSLGRSLGAMAAVDRLTAAWPVACGPAMARRGEVVRFESGILTVRVVDAVWLDQLRGMQQVLQRELARIADVKLGGIHFELQQCGSTTTGRAEE